MSNTIKTTALRWLLRLNLEQPTEADRQAFATWCAANPQHLRAYRRLAELWSDTAGLHDLRYLVCDTPLHVNPPSKLLIWLGTLSLYGGLRWGGIFLGIVAGFFYFTRVSHTQRFATAVGEIRRIELADGSQMTLSPQTLVQVSLSHQQRRVELLSGEAFFAVTRDPQRRFEVSLGETTVGVIGTQFDVRRIASDVRVSVLEGAVRVAHTSVSPLQLNPFNSDAETRVLLAGQELDPAPGGALGAVHGSRESAGSWRVGRLVYVDTPLEQIVADANRYSHHHIAIADARVGELRVSLTLDESQLGSLLDQIGAALPIHVRRLGADQWVVEARQ